MHVRLHASNVEIWESHGKYRRTHVWRVRGSVIPPIVLQAIPEAQRPLLQEKVERLIRGSFPEPIPSRKPDVDAERFLEEATEMCSRLRWGKTSPVALSQLLVAAVRLKDALVVAGVPLPKGQRCGRSANRSRHAESVHEPATVNAQPQYSEVPLGRRRQTHRHSVWPPWSMMALPNDLEKISLKSYLELHVNHYG